MTLAETKILKKQEFNPTWKYDRSLLINIGLFVLNINFFIYCLINYGFSFISVLFIAFNYFQFLYICGSLSKKTAKLTLCMNYYSNKVLNDTISSFEKNIIKKVCTDEFFDYYSLYSINRYIWEFLYSNLNSNEKIYQACKVDSFKLYNIFYNLIKRNNCHLFFTTSNRIFLILWNGYLIVDCEEIESVNYNIGSLYKNINNDIAGILTNATIKTKDGIYIRFNNIYSYYVELIIKEMQKAKHFNNNYDCVKGQLNKLRTFSKKKKLKRKNYRILYKKARRTPEDIIKAELEDNIRLLVGLTLPSDSDKMRITLQTKVDIRLINYIIYKVIRFLSDFETIVTLFRILCKL